MRKATVYGKPGCIFCVSALDLLESYNYQVTYKDVVTNEDYKQEFKDIFLGGGSGKATLPQIYLGDKYIGGYTELAQYIEETSGGYGDGQL